MGTQTGEPPPIEAPGEDFAPDDYGTNPSEFIAPVILSDAEQGAVSVELRPRGAERRERYRMQDLSVLKITVGRGRLATDRGGQGKHTVAWTFVTFALERLAGRSLEAVIREVQLYLHSLMRNPEQNEACKREARPLIELNLVEARDSSMGIDQWASTLSRMLTGYIQAYQLSSEASVAGHSVSRGEDRHRNALHVEEERLRQGQPAQLTGGELAERAEGLLEVAFGPAYSSQTYARSVWLWRRLLYAAYPKIMAAHGAAIESRVLDAPLAPSWQRDTGLTTVRQLVARYAFGALPATTTTPVRWAYVNTPEFARERNAVDEKGI